MLSASLNKTFPSFLHTDGTRQLYHWTGNEFNYLYHPMRERERERESVCVCVCVCVCVFQMLYKIMFKATQLRVKHEQAAFIFTIIPSRNIYIWIKLNMFW